MTEVESQHHGLLQSQHDLGHDQIQAINIPEQLPHADVMHEDVNSLQQVLPGDEQMMTHIHLFTDPDGQPFRFFLPMSLTSRSAFKQKIESHGGVIVPSELLPNIIKIGDPSRPQSFDASWLNFRYIDDAIREGHLQNAEFYVMDNPGDLNILDPAQPSVGLGQRATPGSGGLSSGVGSRGTRMEFTPEEDDILRRIVHRPGVATSGNKIYQLIASHYGGHSFHSWRDRYIRHMRPIWGPPTDDQVLAVNETDDYILSQSYLRAPHTSANARLRAISEPKIEPITQLEQTQEQHQPQQALADDTQVMPPPSTKKQRASFSTTDDEILLTAIADKGETAATFKYLGARHPHHTWESWKNRVKALKKRNNGVLPKPDDMLRLNDLPDTSQADISMQGESELQNEEQLEHNLTEPIHVDPNIDPNLQHLQSLTAILEDPNQAAFEQQFPEQQQIAYQQNQDLQQQLQTEDTPASTFDFPATEQLLRQNLQSEQEVAEAPSQGPKKRGPGRRGKRQINIHDPTADENAGAVSDIEDGVTAATTTGRKRSIIRQDPKKRKTNAAARAAAARAAASPRAIPPVTPNKETSTQPKSAKQEHHEREKPALVKAVRDDAMSDQSHEPRRSLRQRSSSREPQPAGKDRQQRSKASAPPPNTISEVTNEDDLMAEEQIRRTEAEALSENHLLAPRTQKRNARGEVRATPNSSPIRPPVSQLIYRGRQSPEMEPPSPSPASPAKMSQAFLNDTQIIRGDVDFDFETTMPDMSINSAQLEEQAAMQLAAEERKQAWTSDQVQRLGIDPMVAAEAWYKTSGIEHLAQKIVEAFSQGLEIPRLPGIWTDEEDNVIFSTDATALEELYKFHGTSVDTRLTFLQMQT